MKTDIFRLIGRSHMYWGRKPLPGLADIFREVRSGEIVLDPFCGGGTPAVAALMRGARVVAGDLNPMAAFLTKVLIRPISIASLTRAFEEVRDGVASSILEAYAAECPECGNEALSDYLVWAGKPEAGRPEGGRIKCDRCGSFTLSRLRSTEVRRQCRQAQASPCSWFPMEPISGTRKPPVGQHHELFTPRNLSSLAQLFRAIERLPDEHCRDALRYVFTASLYSCSNMQMFSKADPSSSRGWTAPRFYVPPERKETNVWRAFERRFASFLDCKERLNSLIPCVRVAGSEEEFAAKRYEAVVSVGDALDLTGRWGSKASHVFIDPPYSHDIDYLAFSQFWGCWLGMRFDFEAEWHPRKLKGEGLEKLLRLLSKISSRSCILTLAMSRPIYDKWRVGDLISACRYEENGRAGVLYDHSLRRGQRKGPKRERVDKTDDSYVRLKKLTRRQPSQLTPDHCQEGSAQDVLPYVKAGAFLYHESQPGGSLPGAEAVRASTGGLVPEHLREALQQLKDEAVFSETNDIARNRRCYHSLSLALMRLILAGDGWTIEWQDPSQFESGVFEDVLPAARAHKTGVRLNGVAFVAKKESRRIAFCFEDQDQAVLARIAEEVLGDDDKRFRLICMMIVRSAASMNSRRAINEGKKWDRGFFVCFEDIRRKCRELHAAQYLGICAPPPDRPSRGQGEYRITSFNAEVIANIRVGADNPRHYKLRFRAPKLRGLVPGQFVMMHTKPLGTNRVHTAHPVSPDRLGHLFSLPGESFLKRPFGIHRAVYPGFDWSYLKKLDLPPALATISHTVLPSEFEILYKVIDRGVGTNEMTGLKRGDKVEMLGPLGRRFDLRELRSQGIEEVHVIGGGVGMAPLVFMVQALRFYAFRIKAFIGIENLGMLKHTDDLAVGYYEDPKDASIYVEDLLAAGVKREDIFLSCEDEMSPGSLVADGNFFRGFVSEQYGLYLQSRCDLEGVQAFACGPWAMMRAVANAGARHSIPVKVLLEKRMACGTGVCLSCVCKTKREDGNQRYSRVCTDGPLFEASEIVWT